MSDEEFWNTTPRRLVAMLDAKKEIDREQAKVIGMMTALWMNGHNPDEVLESEKAGIAGIDYPAGELWNQAMEG
jgi:hypothetical protein